MKKIGAVILIFSILFSMVGCQQSVGATIINAEEGNFIKATSYKDIEKYVKKAVRKRFSSERNIFDIIFGNRQYKDATDIIVEESATSGVAVNDSAKPTTDGDYSETNTQVKGVDEADIIKTDGKYIYSVVNNNFVSIVEPYNGLIKQISKVSSDNQDKWIREIFIDENRLIVIWERNYVFRTMSEDQNKTTSSEDKMSILPGEYYPGAGKQLASVEVYDTTDISNPSLLKTLEVEGQIVSTRKIDNVMYLVADKYCYIYDVSEVKEDEIIPFVSEDGSEPKKIDCEAITIFPDSEVEKFTNILTIDIYNTDSNKISSYLAGSGSSMYMNTDSLYLADYSYHYTNNNGYEVTSISKYDIDGININYIATGEVKGHIINQFAMDEYNDFFRVATTDNLSNGVFVFDKNMKQVGKVDDLAKGEMIYSVRFTGEKAYMVTFKTMDPLFVIDLSNPENPKVLGELKIPGFSNYMHPISDNTVLGIGRDTVEIYEKDKNGKEIVVGFRTGGIKLSLFDVTDPENPIEKEKIIFGDEYTNSEALYNHKAIMVDKERNIFGLPVELYDYVNGNNSASILLIKATDSELSKYGEVSIPNNENAWYYMNGLRSLTIGDYLYVKAGEMMYSYNYDNLKLFTTVNLLSK
ncbi:MAG: hypothetical protein K0R15_385 [Clostridiales bacterium]|jgi:uncharacterized secreted protein with C-terminal beta-propeller domain|nr:hypothetical protein [Clostridiales bacterium]